MKFSKRLLSFFLAVLMLVSTFSGTVFAESNDLNTQDTNTEGSVTATELKGKVEGNKEVFTFELPERQAQRRVRRAAPLNQGNDTIVNLTAVGLNGGAFDWRALPNSEFKLTAKWKTADGQEHSKVFATINAAGETQYYVGWPVDGTLAETASIEADFDQNIMIRVTYNAGNGTGIPGGLLFNITITELAEPRANVEYVDPYGRKLENTDLPTGTMPKVTADELTDVEIDLPNSSKEINMRESELIDEDELNTAANGLTFKVDGKTTNETVTIDNKEYKLDISAPNAKQIGTIKMIYQKDVLVPPTKDDGSDDPVAPADGYVRLTFDANENKQDGITGTHNNGLYAGKQKSYIDVKEGLDYTNANLQAAIKELSTTGTKEVNGETKTFAQKAKAPWTPTVPADTTPVAEATYNAQYEKSAAEQVTELGGLNPQTIKVWKGDDIDWAKGVAPKTTDKNDAVVIQSLLDNAEVTDLSKRSSAAQGKFEGKLQVKFGDDSTLEVDKQWLYVWEHIVKVDDPTDPNSPKEEDLPKKDRVKVLFEASTGVKEVKTKGTTYAKNGTVFQDKDFPQDITYEDGYKGPVTWTPKDHTITTKAPNFDKRKQAYIFKASATKLEDIIGPVDPGVTPNPDTKLYWTVTFVSADEKTGTVADENTYYVLKTAKKTLADVTAPKTTPATGYAFEKWTPALDNKTAIDKDITVTGTFTKGGTTPSDKSETPTIDPVTEGDNKITGKGEPEAEIVVKDKDGNEIGKTTVDKDGNWKVTVPADKPLKKDDIITATQTEKGKKPSDPARETVKGKLIPPSFNYLTLTLDENYRGGEITHHDVYEDELIERYLYTPRRRGYVFEGWSYRSDYLDEVRPGDRIYYSTTLYAIWSKDRYYDRDEREEEPEDTREVLEHKAYMFGYTDGTVRPNGRITRAEAAALVTRLLGIESIGAATKPMFTDTPSAWYNKAINAAVQRGIMKGYPDGRFRPNAPITRAEFTQMIAQIDNKPYGIAPFADVKGHWAELAIGREYQAKRIMGYPDGTFRPNAHITRCEAVVILNKMFERNYDDMSAVNAMNRHLIKSFLDLSQSFWGYNDMVEATNDHDFKRRVKGRIEEDWTLVK